MLETMRQISADSIPSRRRVSQTPPNQTKPQLYIIRSFLQKKLKKLLQKYIIRSSTMRLEQSDVLADKYLTRCHVELESSTLPKL